jgi:TolB-like protein
LKKNYTICQAFFVILVSLLVFMGEVQTVTAKEDIKTIAILPFKVNAAEKSAMVREGIGHMLYSRLSWRDNVMVIPTKKIKTHLSDINNSKPYGIDEIALLTHSDFVLAGTITRLGGSFSIDIQVYDIENKRYMAFFEQSQKKDELVDKINRIAATINKKIFDRSTMAWEKMEQEKHAFIKEQQRKNPEYMMKTPGWQDTNQSVGWKIWKYLF